MKQLLSTLLAVLFIVSLLSFILWGSNSKRQKDPPPLSDPEKSETIIFFYGITCPHCTDVEEWMAKNSIEEKLDIIKKEVYENRQNALELETSAKMCGLPTNSVGVPFLFTHDRCLIGSPDIINYLTEMATNSSERNSQ